MAKKKTKKKEDKKKKVLKIKLKKKKDAKKKAAKKKEAKKKDKKKKDKKKKSPKKKQPIVAQVVEKPAEVTVAQPKKPVSKKADHSTNYKAIEAVKKLKSLKERDEILAFTKGEKRVTVTKATATVLNRLK